MPTADRQEDRRAGKWLNLFYRIMCRFCDEKSIFYLIYMQLLFCSSIYKHLEMWFVDLDPFMGRLFLSENI